MLKVAMYSYKGGAGRTVATANIAAQLALMGKRVVCLDFDLDGPGLQIVFGVTPTIEDRYVQDYMNAATAESFPLHESFIDISDWFGGVGLAENQLFLFSASQNYKKRLEDIHDYRKILDRIQFLLKWIEHNIHADIVFLDCASGWRVLPKACTASADRIVVFLRLARQHVLGSVLIGRLFRLLEKEFGYVPSAIPIDLLSREEYYHAYIKALESTFEEKPNLILSTLPEYDRLKWNETPLCLDADEMAAFNNMQSREANEHIIQCYKNIAEIIADSVK